MDASDFSGDRAQAGAVSVPNHQTEDILRSLLLRKLRLSCLVQEHETPESIEPPENVPSASLLAR